MAANFSHPNRTLSDIEDSESEMRGEEWGTSAVCHPLSSSEDIETVYQPHEFFCFGKVAVPKDAPTSLRISLNLVPLSAVFAVVGIGVIIIGTTVLNTSPEDWTPDSVGFWLRIFGPIVLFIGVAFTVLQILLICKGKQYIKTGWETEKELDKARRRARELTKKYAASV